MVRINDEDRFAALNTYERDAQSRGFRRVAGVDEAGRGPLAGPVAAAAVILDPERPILGLNDSKKISPQKRERLFDAIQEKALAWSVVLVEPAVIDQINILQATLQAMRQAVAQLQPEPDLLLVDAVRLDLPGISSWPIIGGDAKSNSIAAASILAKVTRDRVMLELDRQYPGYGFAQHKGYGTANHYAALAKLGRSPCHRLSFLKNLSDHV
jgi:ribonuclease HII